ncbi:MAG: 50S ribosome-binding GTPase [Treponema sp.]|nr:50S ribosome-binding GTPase [Treponema sp.]
MSEDLKFHELAVRKDNLQRSVLDTIAENNADVAKRLEQSLFNQGSEEKLKIAFVGQHNAGKSTIVSALTGNRQIKISNNVETDAPADYAWEGVLLTDTPGLYAGKKEEHDAVSLQKIKESDLLVFCITSSLFDDLLIKNFVELAYKQSYKSKIFIVINKMSQESGEFDQLVTNYKETLTKTLEKEGGNFADFPVSFIDAHDFIEGLEDSEPDLMEYSNFKSFVTGLNNYISSKKLFAKLDTPCRMMIGTVDEEITNTSTDLDKNMMALLRQSESVVRKHKNDVKFYIHDAEQELRNDIMAKANELIGRIGAEEIPADECARVNEEIQALSERKIADIQEHLDEVQSQMITDVGEVLTSDMGNFVMAKFENKEADINIPVNKDFSNFVNGYKEVSGLLATGGSKVLSMAGGAGNLAKVSMVSGSQLHTIVLNVGHFFGASFKPWQAVNIATKIGKVANALGPILSGIGVIVDIASKAQQEKQIKDVQDAKRDTFNQFSSIASDIIAGIEKQYKDCENQVFDNKTLEIDNIRKSLIKNNNNNSEYVNRLKKYREDLYLLTNDIANA